MKIEDVGVPIAGSLAMALLVDWLHGLYHNLLGSGLLIDNAGSIVIAAAVTSGYGIVTDRDTAISAGIAVGAVHTLHHFLQPAFIGMGEAVVATTFLVGILGLGYNKL